MLRDWLTRFFFEWGAPLYARKLSWGPEAALREEFVKFLPLLPTARILDVGCGPGHVARKLAADGARVIGADRSRRMACWARRAAKRAGVEGVRFVVAGVEQLPFSEDRFDITCATTVLYLLPEPRRGLAEMLRVTQPGGWVATMDPASGMNVTRMREYAAQAGLNAQETRQLVQWAYAVQWYGGLREEDLTHLYQAVGCEEVRVEHRLDDLVLFARGRVGGDAFNSPWLTNTRVLPIE